MPNWKALLDEIKASGSTFDLTRRAYLRKLYELTGRNVIIYYSGWLQAVDPRIENSPILVLNDADKNGFMAAIHELDRSKGLDLILHTPGGEVAATESLVDYLRAMFGNDIRAIVPQLALSAGTMVACACKEIIMGKHSSLGPIDPQVGGAAAHGVIEEFQRAVHEVSQNQLSALLWQPIIAKYPPTFIGECEKAISWANQMVKDWLVSGMFHGEQDASTKAAQVLSELASHALTLSHNRHISIAKARSLGLKITALEDNDDLQEAVLSVHHVCIQTLTETPTLKIIENQNGVAFIQGHRSVLVAS